jgi:hypothetical protein
VKERDMPVAKVVIPNNHPNPPEDHEVMAAEILARHYNTVVLFMIPVQGYMTKTLDIAFEGLIWEMKSPIGKSRTTIGNQFKAASKQRAQNIVFDARRTALRDDVIRAGIRLEKNRRKSIKRIILITKEGRVEEIS